MDLPPANKTGKPAAEKPIIDFSLPFRLISMPFFYITLLLVLVFDRLIYGIRVIGKNNLRPFRKKGCFLISNHSLYLDPGVIADALLPSRAYFSAMSKSFKIPLVGQYIRFLGAFPIPDENPMARILKPIMKALKKRYFVHFFPEGELVLHNHELAPFKEGVFYFSQLLDVPIVPVILLAKPRKLFGIMRLPGRFMRITVVILPPIGPGDYRAGDKREAIRLMTEDAHRKMSDVIKDFYGRE